MPAAALAPSYKTGGASRQTGRFACHHFSGICQQSPLSARHTMQGLGRCLSLSRATHLGSRARQLQPAARRSCLTPKPTSHRPVTREICTIALGAAKRDEGASTSLPATQYAPRKAVTALLHSSRLPINQSAWSCWANTRWTSTVAVMPYDSISLCTGVRPPQTSSQGGCCHQRQSSTGCGCRPLCCM